MNALAQPALGDAPSNITLTPRVAALLAIVAALLAIAAAHDRMTPENFLAAAICRRIEEIGICSAVDWMERGE